MSHQQPAHRHPIAIDDQRQIVEVNFIGILNS
jgi:hypothetical protein